jgi:aromatic ring hydroxylase
VGEPDTQALWNLSVGQRAINGSLTARSLVCLERSVYQVGTVPAHACSDTVIAPQLRQLHRAIGRGTGEDGMRTGQEYLDSLNDGRRVVISGELIDNVATHPLTRGYAKVVADFYDFHLDPDMRDELTFVDDDGVRRSLMWLHPRSLDDLRRRRRYHTTIAKKFTAGFWGRLPDANNCMFIPYLDDPDPWAENSLDMRGAPITAYNISEGIVATWHRFRNEDLNVTPSFINPQVDRSGPGGEANSTTALRTVDMTDKGIVVDGWKPVGTGTTFGDWLHVGTFWRPGVPPEQVQYFTVPNNVDGLTIYNREPVFRTDAADHPISSIGDEYDSMIHFDNVFVPWEHVFHVGNTDHAKMYPDRIFDPLQYHIVVRMAVKAELIAGLAILVAFSTGTLNIPAVQSRVGQLCEFREMMRAWLVASEELGFTTLGGTYKPRPQVYDAGRGQFIEHVPKVMHELVDLCGRHVTFLPSEHEWSGAGTHELFDAMLATDVMSGENRIKLFRTIRDLFLSDWGKRQMMFENFNGTPIHTRRMLTMSRAHEYSVAGPLAKLAAEVCRIPLEDITDVNVGMADAVPDYIKAQDIGGMAGLAR